MKIPIWNSLKAWLAKNRRILRISSLVSLIITVVSYFVANSAYSLPGDNGALQKIDDIKEIMGMQRSNMPDSLLLVNVSYDKQLIPFEENGMPVGNTEITDRGKLLQLLKIAKEANNYRYIFLDVNFEKGYESPVDSELFQTIASMDRIVLPHHDGTELLDSTLYPKSANADYFIHWKVLVFSRYQFIRNGDEQTVALRMYADKKGEKDLGITPHLGGLWYSDDGRLCHNGVTLLSRIAVNGGLLDQEGQMRERNYIYLGADLLDIDSIIPVRDQIEDKIVIIGDFINDRHAMYNGSQPGSTICLNAYLALMEGDHLVNWWFILLMFVVYTIVGTFYLQGNSFSSLFSSPWLSVAMSFFSTATLFWVISLILNWYGLVFNVWAPTFVYSLIDTYVQKRNLYNSRKKK